MTRVQDLNIHRWIIFHVAFILQSKAESLSPPSQPPPPPAQVSSRTTVFAVLVTLFFLIGLLSVYIRQCARSNPDYSTRYNRRRRAYDDGCSRGGGLDDTVVESFPVFAYSSVKNSKIGIGGSECSICLNEFEDRETVRLLPVCNHLFHMDCIGAWLYSHVTCPVCRSNLTAKSNKKSGEVARSPPIDHVVIDIRGDSDANKSHLACKFPRSNSTGHSIGRLGGDNAERYTLRLPDDVMRNIMTAKGRKLKRTRSFDGG